MTISDPSPILVQRLRSLMPPVSAGTTGAGPGLFGYCALARERIADIRLDSPVVGIVLDGSKELWLGNDPAAVCVAGSAFVVPADTPLTVVNIPDPRRGYYRTLILDMDAARLPVKSVSPQTVPGLRLQMTAALEAALWHAAEAITEAPSAPAVRQARLDELAALLLDDPAGVWLATAGVAQRLSRLLAADPARRWTVDIAAAELGMANATLRRRLASEGSSFRDLVAAARLDVAHRVLAEAGRSGVAAAAAGLASRGHFARAYRSRFGVNPSENRVAVRKAPHTR